MKSKLQYTYFKPRGAIKTITIFYDVNRITMIGNKEINLKEKEKNGINKLSKRKG